MDRYKIFIENKSPIEHNFWAFLGEPDGINGPKVYSNSGTALAVDKWKISQQQENSFGIPLQYSVQASASNKAVKMKTYIQSRSSKKTDIRETWNAEYTLSKEGPQKGPSLKKSSETADKNCITINTNQWNKNSEGSKKWYSSMSFGIESDNGYMGVTWSPEPMMEYHIQPKLKFYIAIGSYKSHELVDINTISRNCQVVSSNDFSDELEATVSYENGKWKVKPGPPELEGSNIDKTDIALLLRSHSHLTFAHAALTQRVTEHIFAPKEKSLPSTRFDKKINVSGKKIKFKSKGVSEVHVREKEMDEYQMDEYQMSEFMVDFLLGVTTTLATQLVVGTLIYCKGYCCKVKSNEGQRIQVEIVLNVENEEAARDTVEDTFGTGANLSATI